MKITLPEDACDSLSDPLRLLFPQYSQPTALLCKLLPASISSTKLSNLSSFGIWSISEPAGTGKVAVNCDLSEGRNLCPAWKQLTSEDAPDLMLPGKRVSQCNIKAGKNGRKWDKAVFWCRFGMRTEWAEAHVSSHWAAPAAPRPLSFQGYWPEVFRPLTLKLHFLLFHIYQILPSCTVIYILSKHISSVYLLPLIWFSFLARYPGHHCLWRPGAFQESRWPHLLSQAVGERMGISSRAAQAHAPGS